jgi:hypothetical protein
MKTRLQELSEETLRRLADAITSGRLGPPWDPERVAHATGGPTWLPAELADLTTRVIGPRPLGWALQLLVDERKAARERWEGIELTWTGPEDLATETRDTGAVARQLFASARRDLLISTFVVDDDEKGAALLGVLREQMARLPDLRVRFFVNIQRAWKDPRPPEDLVSEYAAAFWSRVWPWDRRPEVYFDRRSVVLGHGDRACLHAKVVIQDLERTLVTSANLTEAAQERNIEAGVLVADAGFATRCALQFDRLVQVGVLVPLPR